MRSGDSQIKAVVRFRFGHMRDAGGMAHAPHIHLTLQGRFLDELARQTAYTERILKDRDIK